jgi:mono/diheme cytochrome c family protein
MRLTIVALAAMAVPAVAVLGPGTRQAQEADGAALYKTHCAKCHGEDGVTPEPMAKRFKSMRSLTDPATIEGVSEDSTVAVIDNGVGLMKAFKGTLDHDQEVAIAKYIRAFVKESGEG